MTHEEMILKAKEAKTAEELLAMAKENGMELTEESAKAYFEQLHKIGELSDNELENVAGGHCHTKDGRMVVSVADNCPLWTCKDCGRGCYGDYTRHRCRTTGSFIWAEYTGVSNAVVCNNCKDLSYENGLWLCNHAENRK